MSRCDYAIDWHRNTLDDGATTFFGSHPDLPGCCADGNTLLELLDHLRNARRDYQQALMDDGLPIPPAHVERANGVVTYYFGIECGAHT